MNDIGEALGTASEGALLGRAVEPKHGEAAAAGAQPGASGHTHESACLNCGTALIGPHCHACGQRAHVHRTIGAFLHDLLHGALHFEGKTFRTLPLLVWNPGKLTREYIDGKRASYVSPIALFLFVVFLSYAVFSVVGGSQALSPGVTGIEQVRSAYDTNETQLAELRSERESSQDDPEDLAEIDERIAELEEDQRGLEMVLGGIGSEFETNFRQGFEANPLPEGNAVTEAWEKVTENPQLAIYKLQTNAYKFSWMLIPLSVPFVWLLFPFSRRFRGYDHTIFTTYSIAFMVALAAAASLLFYFNLPSIGGLLLFYAPYHMYRQLRGTYGTSRFGAFWRMLALSLFAWIAIGLFLAAMGWMAG
jgi:hypothetical protein